MTAYVISVLSMAGIYAILDLHWTAPGALQPSDEVPREIEVFELGDAGERVSDRVGQAVQH